MSVTIDELRALPGNSPVLDYLKENVKTAIPFVGAGLSMPFGFPGWPGFLLQIAAHHGLSPAIQKMVDGSRYEEATQHLLDKIKHGHFSLHCKNAFGDANIANAEIKGPLSLMPHVFGGSVITTNLDNLIKKVYSQERRDFDFYHSGLDGDIAANVLRGGYKTLLKIHGDLLDPKKRILTPDQYDANYNGGPLAQSLLQIANSRHLVFLGCSLNVDRTMDVMRACLQNSGEAPHIALLSMPDGEDALDVRLEQLSRFNILPVWYPAGKREAVEVILRWLLPPDHPKRKEFGASSNVNGSASPAPSPRAGHPAVTALANSQFFIGREKDMAAVIQYLRSHKSVSITGTGGSGKTTLARKILQATAEDYPDGRWFVELASLVDPELLQREIGRAMDLAEQNRELPTAVLKDYLTPRKALLVLDNCERMADACATLINDLSECPHLRILTTSTRKLAVPGQQIWHLEPLGQPAAGAGMEEVEQAESSALFLHLVRLNDPSFRLGEDDANQLTNICRALEGIPLAIEIAAARYPYLSLSQIAKMLERFLAAEHPDQKKEGRHRKLEAAIGWSVSLLSAEAQEMLLDLSVFRGGCSLQAASKVCLATDGDQTMAIKLLSELIDNSLIEYQAVSHQSDQSGRRYRLLEPIRLFGQEQLQSDRHLKLRWRHYEWCLNFVKEPAGLLAQGKRDGEKGATLRPLDQLQLEHDNIRCAMDWCTDNRDVDAGMRLGVQMWRFWEVRGFYSEGEQELKELIERAGPGNDQQLRAQIHSGLGILYYRQGAPDLAKASFDSAIALEREHGTEPMRLAICLSDRAILINRMGHSDEALATFQEFLKIAREQGDHRQTAVALFNIGDGQLSKKNYEEAETLLLESESLFRKYNCDSDVGYPMNRLGWLRFWKGEWQRAKAQFDRVYENREKLGSAAGQFDAMEGLLWLAIRGEPRNLEDADRLFDSAVILGLQIQSKLCAARLLECAALLCMARGRHMEVLAAKLISSRLRKELHWQLMAEMANAQNCWIIEAKARLSPAEVDQANALADEAENFRSETDEVSKLLHLAKSLAKPEGKK